MGVVDSKLPICKNYIELFYSIIKACKISFTCQKKKSLAPGKKLNEILQDVLLVHLSVYLSVTGGDTNYIFNL